MPVCACLSLCLRANVCVCVLVCVLVYAFVRMGAHVCVLCVGFICNCSDLYVWEGPVQATGDYEEVQSEIKHELKNDNKKRMRKKWKNATRPIQSLDVDHKCRKREGQRRMGVYVVQNRQMTRRELETLREREREIERKGEKGDTKYAMILCRRSS